SRPRASAPRARRRRRPGSRRARCSFPRSPTETWPRYSLRMRLLADVLVALIALEHVYILVMEMFLWQTPTGLRAFAMDAARAETTAVMAKNQGLYNGFLAAGLLFGLLGPLGPLRPAPMHTTSSSSSSSASWSPASTAASRRSERSSICKPAPRRLR